MNGQFQKRIYTLPAFLNSAADIFNQLDEIRAAARGGRISRTFAEKIMLAVTQVNGCRYCSFGHSRAALAAGVTEEELQYLLAGEIGEFPPVEATALAFAQHYAESGGRPDPEAWQCLVNTYGGPAAQDILIYIRMITIGNLYGNTLDALLSRLSGLPAPRSSLFSELSVLLSPFFLLPNGLILLIGVRFKNRLRKPMLYRTVKK